jgi:hypothetical protein
VASVVGDDRRAADEVRPAFLVETLLDRGGHGDVQEAETAIDRLAAAPIDGLVTGEIWLLRLRTQLARAHGDDMAYRNLVAIARWRHRSASKGIWRWPRR